MSPLIAIETRCNALLIPPLLYDFPSVENWCPVVKPSGFEQSSPFQLNCVLRLWILVCCIPFTFDKFGSDHHHVISCSTSTSQLLSKFPKFSQKASMETPNFNELIERLEKLEIRSQSSVISRKVALGPYDPPPIPAALFSNIAKICQVPKSSSEEAR